MKVYFQVFVNFKQNNWAKFLPIVEFVYNNAKNTITGHRLFELNCGYYFWMSYKKEFDFCFQFKSADKLLEELRELMIVCCENLYHTQKLQKRIHDKRVKPKSYVSGKKIWLNSKYIKTKRNCNFEANYFEQFQVLYLVEKQAYKLELPRSWKIYNVFHVSLLKQDITRKGRVDKMIRQMEFNAEDKNGGEYKVEVIQDSAVFAKETDGHLLGLYYLIAWKGYPEKKNTWEPFLSVMHPQKMISIFHKDYPKEPIATSSLLDTAPPMAWPIVNFPTKQKQRQSKGRTTKRAKWGDKEESKSV